MMDSRSSIQVRNVADYYPMGSPLHDDTSRLILQVKYGNNAAIFHFAHQLDRLLPAGVVVCTYPSHDPANLETGIRRVARLLCLCSKRVDGTHCLIRTRKILKATHGGTRTVERQLDSLGVIDAGLLAGHTVVLMDDVSTTGASLTAGKEMLQQAGAAEVRTWCIGRTVSLSQTRAIT